MKINDNTNISLPIRNLVAIIGAVALGVWAYFGVEERLNKLETADTLFAADLLKSGTRTKEFRNVYAY